MVETGAEIALHSISKKDEKPLVYRAVKPEAPPQRGLLFRGHRLIPDHDLHRVSGRQRHHHKDDEADTQKNGHELKKAFKKLSKVHARYSPFRSRLLDAGVVQVNAAVGAWFPAGQALRNTVNVLWNPKINVRQVSVDHRFCLVIHPGTFFAVEFNSSCI